MDCITINDLPPAPENKKGWPWTIEDSVCSVQVASEKNLPMVSIITPSYNQGRFIEETIRSVLLQGYPNLEYIIIDGGSSDNTVEVLKKYEPWLKYWVSEPDKGQSHAINKGFKKAEGDLLGWLNSDDYFFPFGLHTLVSLRKSHPSAVAWVGACRDVDINGQRLRRRSPWIGGKKAFANWSREAWIPQPSCLFDADTFHQISGLDENLHYVMDVDLWMRLAERGKFAAVDKIVSCARMYAGIKTRKNIPMQQAEHIFINFKHNLPEVARERMARCMEFSMDAMAYRKLLRYFLMRTRRWLWQLWQSFCWLCGR
jgi:glycosyltransferase involved in cell wall biosynthesis